MNILSFFRRRKVAPPVPSSGEKPALTAAPTVERAPRAMTLEAPARPAAAAADAAVLVSPAVTEKAMLRQAEGWYTFRVQAAATKPNIRRAVEQQFGVHVDRVRVTNVPGKARRRAQILGHVPGYRKALVRLREGERIQLDTAGTAG